MASNRVETCGLLTHPPSHSTTRRPGRLRLTRDTRRDDYGVPLRLYPRWKTASRILWSFLLSVCLYPPHVNAKHCPRGLTGAACDTIAWPSCIVGDVRFDCEYVATCDCFRECDADYALGRHATTCYNVTAPRSLDHLFNAPTIVYRRKDVLPSGGNGCPECLDPAADTPRLPDEEHASARSASCKNACGKHGVCTVSGHCRCLYQMSLPGSVSVEGDAAMGDTCALYTPPKPCIDPECSGNGHCVNGVCYCDDGHDGAACEFPPLRPTDAQERLRIFVYTLPPGFNVYRRIVSPDRNIGWLLWRDLMHSPYRTHDPYDADYFFVPVFPMGDISEGLLIQALFYVRRTWPYWNESSGHNHLVFGAYDFGLCGIAGYPEFQRVRQISHYGLTAPEKQHQCICSMCGPSYRRGIDIVVPDTMEAEYKRRRPANILRLERKIQVFFSGKPTNDWRKSIYRLRNTTGWTVADGFADLAEKMLDSVFCLDVGGAGFSTRFTLAVILGCIPVYLNELEQPWADVLDLNQFSIPFAQTDVHKLPQILGTIQNGTVRRMQLALTKHWRAYHWTSFNGLLEGQHGDGGDAWHTLIGRLIQLKS